MAAASAASPFDGADFGCGLEALEGAGGGAGAWECAADGAFGASTTAARGWVASEDGAVIPEAACLAGGETGEAPVRVGAGVIGFAGDAGAPDDAEPGGGVAPVPLWGGAGNAT